MNFTLDEIDVSGKEADRLARQIFVKIADGTYSEGRQLPSVRELAGKTSLTDYSARKVVSSLAKAGLVETVSRKGIFVSDGAKKRAVNILEKYDNTFNGISNKQKKKTIAIAAAFKQTIDGTQICHPQTVSGIFSEAAALGFEVELINFNVDITDPNVMSHLVEANGYSGIIWLYPEVGHWDSINYLRENHTPIVISSHWLFDTPLPCVQVKEYNSTVSILRYLADVENCDVINWFSTENFNGNDKNAPKDYAKVASSGGDKILKMAMAEIENRNCNLNIIEYNQCHITTERMLKDLVHATGVKNGIVIAASSEYTDFFKRYPDCYDNIKNHSLVVAATMNQFINIAHINDGIGKVNVCLVPFEDVGRALATKISGVLAGRFAENTTLVNTIFSTYSEILEKQNNFELENNRYSPVSDVYEQAGLLLTV